LRFRCGMRLSTPGSVGTLNAGEKTKSPRAESASMGGHS
jgi:hypothetical protein